MARVEEVGEADGWRCWLCDEPVDRTRSADDPRGASVDAVSTKGKERRTWTGGERLAHRACNTRKGAVAPVVAWPGDLFVSDPAPIVGSVERLSRKGGREVVARCPTEADGLAAASWLEDRVARLAPTLHASAVVEAGGGQHLVILTAPRPGR